MLSPEHLQKFFDWSTPNANFSTKITIQYRLVLKDFVIEYNKFFFLLLPVPSIFMLSGWRVEDLRDALPLCDAELLEYELKTAGYESDFFKNMKEWDEEEKEGEEEGEEVEEDDDDDSVEMYVEAVSYTHLTLPTKRIV